MSHRMGLLRRSLCDDLKETVPWQKLRFEGLDIYMRCITHVLDLIAGGILATLSAGSFEEADATCNHMAHNQRMEPLLIALDT